jgi:hypothetical protein
MAKIYNSDLTKGIAKNAGIQQNVDKVPNELAEKVVPTLESNPKIVGQIYSSRGLATNATNGVILAAQSKRDVYIHGAFLTLNKTATATSTYTAIEYTDENGAAQRLLQFVGYTLTAQNESISVSFPRPIKIKRNTAIQLLNGTANADIISIGIIYYSLDDVSNA